MTQPELNLPAVTPTNRDKSGRFVRVPGKSQRAKMIETTAKLRAEVYGGKVPVRHYVRLKHRDDQDRFV